MELTQDQLERLQDEEPLLATMIQQSQQDTEAADAEANRSRVAFVTGRFEQYWQARADEAQARLDEIYGGEPNPNEDGQEAVGGDREPRSDGGSGIGRGG